MMIHDVRWSNPFLTEQMKSDFEVQYGTQAGSLSVLETGPQEDTVLYVMLLYLQKLACQGKEGV